MTRSDPSPKDVLASFPYPVLDPIATDDSPPTYATILHAQTQLNRNAASLSYPGQADNMGHLSLTLLPAAYNVLQPNAPFTPPTMPVRPNPQPGDDPLISKLEFHIYEEERYIFLLHRACDQALVSQLIAAVPATYLAAITDPVQGLTRVSAMEIMAHLSLSFGMLTPSVVQANKNNMEKKWDPTKPIETLFHQLRTAQMMMAGTAHPIDDLTLMTTGFELIRKTNILDFACKLWVNQATINTTFVTFTQYFSNANRARKEADAITAAAAPQTYQGASTYAPTAMVAVGNAANPRARSYCWSHGEVQNMSHSSATCRNKSHGHQDAATLTNQMGGSTRVYTDADRRPRTVAPAAAAANQNA